ncbi:uncharacterized protein LOC122319473 [Drosophila yakuba]|uniref:uncharacterized protein LOC122319473 n=1 Tax=Drosophila yakuba TaxID=7245 RepID=UPI001C89E0F9|nr:uncharacterized protein LOC122319473 [Drosophila yakuba]
MRADPNLSEFGNRLRRIRRTQQGELLLEVKGKPSENVPLYRGAIEESPKEMAEVRTGKQRMALTCSGMDEATTVEELHSCLVSQFEGINVAPEDGSVNVGWSRCRINQDVRPTRCFRCLGYGHRATNCKAANRSDCCLRCGVKGRGVAPPKWLICSENVDRNHSTGAPPTRRTS